jgi:hypothetical protein
MSEQSDDAAKAAVENNLAANLENTSIGEDENSSENNKQPQCTDKMIKQPTNFK